MYEVIGAPFESGSSTLMTQRVPTWVSTTGRGVFGAVATHMLTVLLFTPSPYIFDAVM